MPGYSADELARARAALAGGGLDAAGADAGLLRKLQADPLLADYSPYALLPIPYRRIYQQGERPAVTYIGRSRGRGAIFRFADGAGLVVKPLQSRREAAIAALAGELQVGPAQLPTLDGFITEEFVAGPFFTDLPPQAVTGEAMHRLGQELGRMLAALHARRICYNDATLSDPEGRSHLIIPPGWENGPAATGAGCRLIDFGVSVLLDYHPRLEPEEVYNLARTTPEFRLFSGMGLAGAALAEFLEQYRQRLAGASAESILARDLRFVQEGLRMASTRMGDRITPPFQEGFNAAYGPGNLTE